ncbi:hypothetical protein OOT46_12715 [Aquabacterium sp. A7-Y]|uniref:hypothetical protein n=1 Tax=Aquabacterium sp. A7-Y TaxID=1349605 RepID=UPI00223DAA2B|nr:hypothetical protein [Aquabacterium sp. A7-Y]MCW7538706.1 hypothetical protein [Aquabacterium sp. A7-Y]
MPPLPRLPALHQAPAPPLRLYRLLPGEPVPERLRPDWEFGVDQLLSSCGDAESVLWEAARGQVLERRYGLVEAGGAGRPVSLTVIRTLLDEAGRPLAWWQRSIARPDAGPIVMPSSGAAHRSIYCVEAEDAPLWATVQQLCCTRFASEHDGPAPAAGLFAPRSPGPGFSVAAASA